MSLKSTSSEALSAWQPRGNKKVFKQRKEEGSTLVRILLRIAGELICWPDNPDANNVEHN